MVNGEDDARVGRSGDRIEGPDVETHATRAEAGIVVVRLQVAQYVDSRELENVHERVLRGLELFAICPRRPADYIGVHCY